MKKIYITFLFMGTYFIQTSNAQVTYNQVANIFFKKCTYCHNPVGIESSILLDNYAHTSSYASAIKTYVSSHQMPPWPPDTAFSTSGHAPYKFVHSRALDSNSYNSILRWIADGALEGPTPSPVAPGFTGGQYTLSGTPDQIVQIPPFQSNASDSITNPYDCFAVPMNLSVGKWIKAFEICPGDLVVPGSSSTKGSNCSEIVHHVVVTIDSTHSVASQTDGKCFGQSGFGLGGWSCGSSPVVFPSSSPLVAGVYVPAGSNMIIQIHFAPGSGGRWDSTSVRLYYYTDAEIAGIRQVYSNVFLQYWGYPGKPFGMFIPPNSIRTFTAKPANSTSFPYFSQSTQLPDTAAYSIFSINVHSHYVCTSISNIAVNASLSPPDTMPLINVPNWNYTWQGNYYYPKLVKIPPGYTLWGTHVYNNTPSNPNLLTNYLDTVYAGTATTNEMFFDAIQWLKYQKGDENINIDSLLKTSPLLDTGIPEYTAPVSGVKYSVYPNPASGNLGVYFSKRSQYIVSLYNTTGQNVFQTQSYSNAVTIDVSSFPPGLYIIQATDVTNNARSSSKVVISN